MGICSNPVANPLNGTGWVKTVIFITELKGYRDCALVRRRCLVVFRPNNAPPPPIRHSSLRHSEKPSVPVGETGQVNAFSSTAYRSSISGDHLTQKFNVIQGLLSGTIGERSDKYSISLYSVLAIFDDAVVPGGGKYRQDVFPASRLLSSPIYYKIFSPSPLCPMHEDDRVTLPSYPAGTCT